MTRPIAISSVLAIATLLVASPAAALQERSDCSIQRLEIRSNLVSFTYDPFDREADPQAIPLRAVTTGCENSRVQLVIVPDPDSLSPAGQLQASNGSQSLSVQATLDGAPAAVATSEINAFSTNSRAGRLAGRSGQLLGEGLRLSLPQGAEVTPGRYRARATVVARVEGQDPATQVQSEPFLIDIDVQPSFRIAAGVERARLWLGELTEGRRSDPLTFLAFSNTRYALKVRSERGGGMTLGGSSQPNAPSVPYSLSISNRPLAWTNGVGAMEFSEPRLLLRTHEVVATTGSVDPNRPAGDYRDWVTIEIAPRIS